MASIKRPPKYLIRDVTMLITRFCLQYSALGIWSGRIYFVSGPNFHVFSDLHLMDYGNWFPSWFCEILGLPDPFAKITVDGNGQCHSTETVKNTLDPKWNSHYDLYIGKNDSITISVWNHRKVQKRQGSGFLGCVRIVNSLIQRLKDTGCKYFSWVLSGKSYILDCNLKIFNNWYKLLDGNLLLIAH